MRLLAFFTLLFPLAAEYASIDGQRVFYTVSGTGAPALVFVHGWTCDVTFWRFQQEGLGKTFRILTVDLPGHGKSDKPEREYTAEHMARGVLAAMDAAKIDKAILVGHSMGVTVNRQIYNVAPNRVQAFVSIDGAIFRGTNPEYEKKLAALVVSMDDVAVRAKFIEGMFTPATTPELRAEIKAKMLATPLYVAKSSFAQTALAKLWLQGKVDVPALAVNRKSQNPGPEKVANEVFSQLEYHALADASHFLMMEKPDEVNAILAAFARKVNGK
jgi:pimeloyl-ACP methyl ester carboxylesterase